jgi:L-iditol 2-dehydrogenase
VKAASLGFETVDTAAGDPVATVRAMTGGLGVDVVLDCAGVPETIIGWAIGKLRRGVGGGPSSASRLKASSSGSSAWSSTISSSWGRARRRARCVRVMPLVESGRLRVREVMTHKFPLSRNADGVATFHDKSSGAIKIIVNP